MGLILSILKVAWPIILEVAPLLLKAFFTADKKPIEKARELQKKAIEEAELLIKGDGDEISKRAETRLKYLDILLRERRLRKKNTTPSAK